MGEFKIGTVITDHGKVGIIKRIIEAENRLSNHRLINLRRNYEIYYYDGIVGYLGCKSLERLIEVGSIEVLHLPN